MENKVKTLFLVFFFKEIIITIFKVSDLKRAREMVEKRAAEQKAADEKNHSEEISFLKRTNQQLKAQLEGIISQKK